LGGNIIKNIKLEPCEYSESFIDKIHELNKTAKEYNCDTVDVNFIEKGLAFAKYYHGSQMRKSGEPYYSHPIVVAEMVSDYIFKSDVLVAALLHDTVEDTELTLSEIESEFNPRVAQIVDRLTRKKHFSENRKQTSAETIIELINYKDFDSILVKICDRIHNISTIKSMNKQKQIKIFDETINHFFSVAIYLENYEILSLLIKICKKYNVEELYIDNFIKEPEMHIIKEDSCLFFALELENDLLQTNILRKLALQ
jgi:(p)ppGpp synthase/HD superfamily hydrolase